MAQMNTREKCLPALQFEKRTFHTVENADLLTNSAECSFLSDNPAIPFAEKKKLMFVGFLQIMRHTQFVFTKRRSIHLRRHLPALNSTVLADWRCL